MGRIVYAPATVIDWKDTRIGINKINGIGKFFIPVFETESELKKEFQHAEIWALELPKEDIIKAKLDS
jgi:hypothetical protein